MKIKENVTSGYSYPEKPIGSLKASSSRAVLDVPIIAEVSGISSSNIKKVQLKKAYLQNNESSP
jgi:hypothetical protein